MNEISSEIKTTVLKLSTDKPVRKTPYQVKGVFIKKHASEPITPMLDGTYRKKLDTTKINNLGWEAKTDLDTGIAKVVESLKTKNLFF